MSTNEIIQYAIVAVILIGAIVWIVRRAIRNRDGNSCCCDSDSCDGCPLSDKKKRHK